MVSRHSCPPHRSTPRRGRGPRLQRGVALIVVLLLSAVITLAVLVFSTSTSTELKIAHNDLRGRQALAVAEAGLNHAMVIIAPSAGDDLGMDEELGETPTGGLATLGTQTSITEDGVAHNYRCASLAGADASSYCVRAFDNFDEESGADSPLDDIDNAIILRSRGTAGNAIRIAEVMVSVSVGPDCAILTQGHLQIGGNPLITGSKGCVHTNNQLRISGNPVIEGGGTATSMLIDISGSPTMEGVYLSSNTLKNQYEASRSGQAMKPIPSVRPMNFGPTAIKLHEHVMNHPRGYRLDADGNIYVGPGFTGAGGAGGAWTCVESPANCTGGRVLSSADKTALGLTSTWVREDKNWGGNAHNDQWKADGSSGVPGVYFVEGSVILGKDWGTAANPWRTTIIALNSIQMPAKPIMTPYSQSTSSTGTGYVTSASPVPEWTLRNILVVSGNDIEINGDPNQNNFAGGFFAHQQIKINGNPDIRGFLIAEDGNTTWTGDGAPNCNSDLNLLCDANGNSVGGNPNIIFNGMGSSLFPDQIKRMTWNDVR